MEPCGTRVESLQSFVEPCVSSGPAALAESCGTLKPSYNLTSNHPAALAEPRGTLLEPCWNGTLPCKTFPGPRRTLEKSGETLVRSTTGWWNSGGNLVEPLWNLTSNHLGPPCSPRRTWSNPGRILVEIWWNPRGTFLKPDHTSPRRNCWNPGGALVEPYLKPPRTTLQPWWNPRGTLPQTTQATRSLEPWWKFGGALVKP